MHYGMLHETASRLSFPGSLTELLMTVSTWLPLALVAPAFVQALAPTPPSRLASPTQARRAVSPAAAATLAKPPDTADPAEADTRYRAALVALGCPKNTVDAEVMLGDLQRHGLKIVAAPEDADIVIVNTCAFVEDAKRESIAAIVDAARLKEDRAQPARGLFVTGCMAQRYAEELAEELPEVDAVVGFESYAEIPAKVREVLLASEDGDDAGGLAQSVLVGSASVPFRSEDDRWQLTPAHTAYLRVAEGCDHECTFCAIPGFRGDFRSKPYDSTLAEATRLVENGVRELNLIAEDTNQFGSDWGRADPRRLPQLLRDLAALDGLEWIRLLYCYPSYFSDELVDEIATNDKVVKYIDIPLQHLSPTVLQRMRRPGAAATEALLARLRAKVPSLVLRSTFICGFPGETEQEHRQLVESAARLGFERGGAFAYSAEEGTPAAEMEAQIEEETKQQRKDEMVAGFQRRSELWAERMVGREVDVMVDRMDGADAIARTQWDALDIDGGVRVPGVMAIPGMLLRVRIVAADGMDLIADPVP